MPYRDQERQRAKNREWMRKYRPSHKDETRLAGRKSRIKKQFSLSLDEYYEMVNQQLGLCAICKKPETSVHNGKVKRLAIDHCHATNKVRALLCSHCNLVLGQAQESVVVLQASIEYLNSFNQ